MSFKRKVQYKNSHEKRITDPCRVMAETENDLSSLKFYAFKRVRF